MRKIRRVMLLIVVFMIAVSIKGNTAFAKYVIQVVPDKAAWTSISVSDAYDACQDLNTDASSLGHTENLKAHLTTNADYYAVSLLTYSAYGNKNTSKTTGNNTGIMNFGTKHTFTSSLMEGASSNNNIKSLYDNINTPYVESVKNSTNRASNEPGRGLLEREFLSSSFGSINYSTQTGYPIGDRINLFGLCLGSPNYGGDFSGFSAGGALTNATFRPVIWNK